MADDLTRINGIGPAAQRALSAAGIETFSAIVAIDPTRPPAIDGLRADWPSWVEQARALVAEGQQSSEGPSGRSGLPDAAGSEPSAEAQAAGEQPAATPGSEDNREPSSERGGGNPATPAPPAPEGHAEVLVVIGPKRGRRRAGLAFGPKPEVLPLAAMTDDEIAAIEGDPVLTTRRDRVPLKEP